MELPLDQEKSQESSKRKGGLRTMPFIIANEVFEKVASAGLQANMIIYLTEEYHMKAASAASIMFISGAVSSFIPIFAAFLSDSYLGRFCVIALGSIMCLSGITLLWLTTVLPGAKPPACDIALRNCQSVTLSQLTILFSAFALMGIGAGGITPCSIAFGADQFSERKSPQREKILETYFNWYYASVGISFLLAVTIVVYVQDKKGWKVGFAVPLVLMVLATAFFLLGSPLYIKVSSHKSMLTGFMQVIVAAIRKRHLDLKNPNLQYHHKENSKLIVPSDNLRFFNKACIIRDQHQNGTSSNPWNVSTVEQVEDLKSVIGVIPMWSTGIIFSLLMSQSFGVLQASTMDRHLGRKFEIPAGSFSVFQLITLTLLSGGYNDFFAPLLAKITRNPQGFTLKQRMGIGGLLSVLSAAVAAAVEVFRRRTASGQGLADDPKGVVAMSAWWLVPQYTLVGLAEAFNVIGQVEFFYSKLPKSMSSFAVALWTLGAGVSNLLGTFIIRLIDGITGRDGKTSWLSSNVNKGHYDYYYFILASLGVGNFLYFLLCCRLYGDEGMKKSWEEEDMEENSRSNQQSINV